MTDEAASVMELPEPPPPPECTADDLLSANAPVTASANTGAAHLIVDGNGGLPAWNQ